MVRKRKLDSAEITVKCKSLFLFVLFSLKVGSASTHKEKKSLFEFGGKSRRSDLTHSHVTLLM